MTELIVATRSSHKLHETRTLLPTLEDLVLLDLDAAGIRENPEEDGVEAFNSFEENALAKARYFGQRSDRPVLADDSGLCVDALHGAPGVHSKRFSNRSDLSGPALDEANNLHLLRSLDGVPPENRTARYVCVIALRMPDGVEDLFRGSVEGIILDAPRGAGGFGYDPLFFLPSIQATFSEVPLQIKNQLSHRGSALRAALPKLRQIGAG